MRTTHDMGVPEVVRDVAVSRTDVLVVAIMAPSTGVVQVSIDLMPEGDVLFDGGPFTLETTPTLGRQAFASSSPSPPLRMRAPSRFKARSPHSGTVLIRISLRCRAAW